MLYISCSLFQVYHVVSPLILFQVYDVIHLLFPISGISCGKPIVPQHGFIIDFTEFTYPNTVTFACDEGYVLTGQSIIRCESNGQWNAATPKCGPSGKSYLHNKLSVCCVSRSYDIIFFLYFVLIVCCGFNSNMV